MSICSIEFLLLLLIAQVVYWWLPTVRLRQLLLSAANGGFLYSLVPDNSGWIALALFVGTGYAIARLLQIHPNRWILALYVAVSLTAFLVLKRYDFLTVLLPAKLLSQTVAVVGLSYLLFRQIHVAVDAMQGQIEHLSIWVYLNYQLNLFGLLAGPIQRYQDFVHDWDSLQPATVDAYAILQAYRRMFLGMIKVVFIAGFCLYFYERFVTVLIANEDRLSLVSFGKLMLVFYLYPAYIYFNFSGYCDVVIGGASLFGLRLPENFDWPFLARNMIEYWTRWHRSLGFWIRDYVFTPMYMSIADRWPSRAASLAFVCYFVSLFLTGVWHGSTWNYAIFGLLNGVGVAAAKLWENWLVKRHGRQWLKRYLMSKPVRAAAVVGTFHFVCLTLVFFPADTARTLKVFTGFAARLAA